MTKHERNCLTICEAAGLDIIRLSVNGRHLKIVCRQGMIVCAKTPSDWRWSRNLRSLAKRVANDC